MNIALVDNSYGICHAFRTGVNRVTDQETKGANHD